MKTVSYTHLDVYKRQRKDINMLSREDFYMIKQMRQQGAYIVDIATQIGCSERTVRRLSLIHILRSGVTFIVPLYPRKL